MGSHKIRCLGMNDQCSWRHPPGPVPRLFGKVRVTWAKCSYQVSRSDCSGGVDGRFGGRGMVASGNRAGIAIRATSGVARVALALTYRRAPRVSSSAMRARISSIYVVMVCSVVRSFFLCGWLVEWLPSSSSLS